MTDASTHRDLLAVDVGNSLVKFGWFPGEGGCETAARGGPLAIAPPVARPPDLVFRASHHDESFQAAVRDWLAELPGLAEAETLIASVHPEAGGRVESVLESALGRPPQRLDHSTIGIPTDVETPSSVGVDRLLCAVVAARLKRPNKPAIAATVGTAITVNLVSAEGVFLGGAILPGLRLAAESLHRGAAALPPVQSGGYENPPEPLGRDTQPAIESGVFWGAVGGLRELVAQLIGSQPEPPDLFITGGNGKALARWLPDARFVPHMVLSGVYHCWADER